LPDKIIAAHCSHKYGNMALRMKTTVELPDELLIAAKKRAAELRRPLRELVEAGLRQQLSAPRGGKRRGRKKVRWVVAKGGLPAGADLADRVAMHEWIDKQT
jgi:hypothetical protein